MELNGIKNKLFSKSFFGIILLLVVIFIEANAFLYPEILPLKPQSTHMWRKTDCASYALNYYSEGLNPFFPRMHNELNGGGKSLGETTLLYYIVACLYVPFGPNEIVYRLFWFLIFISGLIALQQLVFAEIKSLFWSIFVPAILFSVPIIAFYAIGFLPNVPAMSMVFWGWYFFQRFTNTQKRNLMWWSVFFFFMAGWLKAPAIISFMALLCAGFVYLLFFKKIPLKALFNYWPWVLPILLNVMWYSFTVAYAQYFGSTYLSAKLFPYWELEPHQIERIIQEFKVLWREDFFSHKSWLYYQWLAGLCLALLFVKKVRFYALIVFFTILGFGLYTLIFFKAFDAHNYYGINAVILLPLGILFVLKAIKQLKIYLIVSPVLGVLALILLYHNIQFTQQRQWFKYNDWPNNSHVSRQLYNISEALDKAGITELHKVISVPDYSPNMSLYLMNRKGVTNFNQVHVSPEIFESYIEQGFEYLIVNNPEELQQPYLAPYIKQLVFSQGDIRGFKLTSAR